MKQSIVETIKNLWGKSLQSLEKELGLGNGSIARWDKNSPSVDKLILVSNKLNVSLDYLLFGIEKPSYEEKKKEAISLVEELTPEEIKKLLEYKDFLISQRNKK